MVEKKISILLHLSTRNNSNDILAWVCANKRGFCPKWMIKSTENKIKIYLFYSIDLVCLCEKCVYVCWPKIELCVVYRARSCRFFSSILFPRTHATKFYMLMIVRLEKNHFSAKLIITTRCCLLLRLPLLPLLLLLLSLCRLPSSLV